MFRKGVRRGAEWELRSTVHPVSRATTALATMTFRRFPSVLGRSHIPQAIVVKRYLTWYGRVAAVLTILNSTDCESFGVRGFHDR